MRPSDRAEDWIPWFVAAYEAIRDAEGRGVDSLAELAGLPDESPTAERGWEWRIRRRSYQTWLTASGLDRAATGRRVLDVGAGVGWLSLRLSDLGHRSVAVDLTRHERHGLGALRRHAPDVACVCADFDRLPFRGGVFDHAVFNASLHYAPDWQRTIAEAARVVRPGGCVSIIDSPIYDSAAQGDAMVAERSAQFTQRFGCPSTYHGGREYLTWPELAETARRHRLQWRIHRPWYGLKFALRPLRARLARRRPPSEFAVLIADTPG